MCRLALLCLGLASVVGLGDEATLRDGRRLKGTLSLDGTAWRFVAEGSARAVPAEQLHAVALSAPPPMLHGSHPMRIVLGDGRHLTGDLIGMDDRNANLGVASMGKVSVPRSAVVALRQPPGTQFVLASLRPGDIELKPSIPSGRLSLSLQAGEDAARRIECVFPIDGKLRPASIDVTKTSVVVNLEGRHGEARPEAGRRRIDFEFGPTSYRFLLDDRVLLHDDKKGIGGPLVAVRLKGSFESLRLHRFIDEPRLPAGDRAQDEVLTFARDQVFGRFLRADRDGIALEGRFGRRGFPWTEVRMIRPAAPKDRPEARASMTVWIDNGFDSQPDILDGEVKAFDDRKLILKHADLGDLPVARGAVRRLLWTGNDQR